ncbi:MULTISPECIES: Ldh family oxidoreductase [unclassified Rhizobium]|uniref:Ldh family oxidoreductase n=1 Tax=unclassified Rhizobium TaxID=2613769 RepID=UPI001AD9D455|nr:MULTISPECIES: Ldh family oxidoreductase [unclassified Rhizobium]MBO9127400.1 Ldh family oxidoreductase [Rhizobium sp. 16-488-2b]MBO9177843.1 Ldh family oxidoreductase [Rhizobium sp. 16-488-2a]
MSSTAIHLPYADLVTLLERVFVNNAVSAHNARILAENCARCERDGSLSHGIFRMAGYVSSLKSGWVDGQVVPEVEDVGPAFVRVDAKGGFTQPAFFAARPLLIEKVKANGVAVLAIRRSHHFSALWPDVEPFAEEGLVALSVVNSMACVVPHGGKKAVFGTNPVAFASPRAGAAPFVFDQASSAIAHGDVQIAARAGHDLKPGMGVDREGQPTNDPNAILDGGALVPFGGHKGNSIALMVEILSAALTGGYFSGEFDWSGHKGAQTPFTGQFFVVIDPARGGNDIFAERVAGICDLVLESGQERLPGDRRHATRAKAEKDGIPLAAELHARLLAMATD